MIQAAILSKVQQLFNAVKPNTDLLPAIKAQTDLISPGGSAINSLQSGTISVVITNNGSRASSSLTGTITSVNTSKAHVIFNGITSASATAGNITDITVGVVLTNATTVTAYASDFNSNVGGTTTIVVAYAVVEYN
jgi:hypothetical protein